LIGIWLSALNQDMTFGPVNLAAAIPPKPDVVAGSRPGNSTDRPGAAFQVGAEDECEPRREQHAGGAWRVGDVHLDVARDTAVSRANVTVTP
jgi:hypothetical protein